MKMSRHDQRGLSIVEMMVGIAVGLFIVSAATMVVTTQLNENRRLLLETQLQQDLRAGSDIVARELRRAGAWGVARESVWYPGRTSAVARNLFSDITASEGGSDIEFEYQRGAGAEGPYGFRLGDNGVIQTQLAGAGWQDLTDGGVMQVTGFAVDVQSTESDRLPCPNLCADGSTDCWPRLVSRTVKIDITANSRSDATVSRTLTTFVRLRNDEVQFNNGAAICP
jgi:type IV pilus assembly protein PilW